MALPLKRVLIFLFIGGLCILAFNWLAISVHQESHISEKDREELRDKIELLDAKAKLQEELGEKLRQDLSKVQAQFEAGNTTSKQIAKVNQHVPEQGKLPTIAKAPVVQEDKNAQRAAAVQKDLINKKDAIVKTSPTTSKAGSLTNGDLVLPILVFACNRAPAIKQCLDDLLRYRPSKEKFPIIVTQDCGDQATHTAIQQYKDVIHAHILQPDLGPIPDLDRKAKKMEGYYKISRHYKWAFGQVFDVMKYKAVIVMEDDLSIAPDFFEYFEAMYSLLKADPTLYCASAWNDNGKASHIEDKPELLYRSDFFPGLGWLMQSSLWDEMRDTWPKGFWDDWFRQEAQRRGRACIRPEIGRTHTFGEKGVSKGLFYKTHLKFMVLNEKMIEWTKKDLSYLKQENYDPVFTQQVYSSKLINLNELGKVVADKTPSSVRIIYNNKNTFKTIAKALDIMNDFKDGVPRTAYKGILTIFHNGIRVYLTPPPEWSKYDPSWT